MIRRSKDQPQPAIAAAAGCSSAAAAATADRRRLRLVPRTTATQGVGVQEVLRALADAVRAGDKAGRAQLMSLLLRLFFFEELPPEAVTTLLPLFQASILLPCSDLHGRCVAAQLQLGVCHTQSCCCSG